MFVTAYKFIRFEKAKSFGILTAIVISIYLIGVELGIFFYLSGLIGGIIVNSNPEYAQVFVVNERTNNVNQLSPFDVRWVNQLRSIDGVDDTHGIVIGNVKVRLPNGTSAPAIIIGSDYPQLAAGPSAQLLKTGSIQELAQPKTVSADFYDNRTFGYNLMQGSTIEINGKTAVVGVTTKNAKGFSTPLLYTTTSKARYFSGLSDYMVNGIIVTVRNHEKVDQTVKAINAIAPGLKAWTAEDLNKTTIVNVMTANNMGMSFGTLIIFGIVSGFFIIGLTMYSATYDRIKDYGTLKAIGASKNYITKLVVMQSLLYAVSGFLISSVLLFVTKLGMANAGLIIVLSAPFLAFLFFVTLLISVGSSLFSINKLKKVEPSSVFR